MRYLLPRLGIALLLASALPAVSVLPAAAQPPPGTNCNLFPADNVLNVDISALPTHAQSDTWKSHMTQHANLHPDLGTFAQQYGLPINVAPPPSSAVTPTFYYDGESDHPAEGYPIDQSTLIEGGAGAPPDSDRHALTVNKNNCKLYEIFNLQNFVNGQTPQAGSGAVWNLSSNDMRPDTWTSADAAGLPMMPLLLRPDEIQAGSISHAIRFTNHCSNAYIWPGSHSAGGGTGCPPMGARFRLRSGFDISGFSANTQVVLRAFQHYGLMMADNGSDWYFGGTTDNWWGTSAGDQVVSELKTIPAAQFDAVDEASLKVRNGSYQAAVLPSAPTGVLAAAGNALAAVSWTLPAGAPFTQFTVAGTPSGSATVSGSSTSATITGLVNGVSYTFRVTATNGYGTGPPSAPSNPITPNAGGYLMPIDPVRILDTRSTNGGHPGRLGPGEAYDVQVAGVGAVDASAAGAVINVTVADGTAPSYLTVYPTGAARPLASNLNFLPGQQIANLAQVAIGAGGKVTVYNDQGLADVIFDANGWYSASPVIGNAGLYFPLDAPNRVLDTRTALGGHPGPLGPGGHLDLKVTGTPGVPGSGVLAVVFNLTEVNGSDYSYLTAYPTGTNPATSSLNFPPNRQLPNRVTVKVGAGGSVSVYNSKGTVDVVADVAGYVGDGSGSLAGGLVFHPAPPVRLFDTRPGYQIGPYGPLGPGATLTAPAAGQGLSPTSALAISANFTVAWMTCGSFLTVYPAGATLPLASDLNFGPGDVLPNLVIVRLGNGSFNAYNKNCTTHLFVDGAGWYDPPGLP